MTTELTATEIHEAWSTSDRSEPWEDWAVRHAAEVHRGRGTKLVVFPDGGAYHFDGGNGQWYDDTTEVLAWLDES